MPTSGMVIAKYYTFDGKHYAIVEDKIIKENTNANMAKAVAEVVYARYGQNADVRFDRIVPPQGL